MRRVLIVVAAAAVTVGAAPPAATANHQEGPCRIHWNLRPRVERREEIHRAVRQLIRCAEDRWSVPGGVEKALAVARCESGFWPWANRYTSSPSKGVYQHIDQYWPSRAHRWLERRWFPGKRFPNEEHPLRLIYNARANVIVTMRMVHAGGWGPWTCA